MTYPPQLIQSKDHTSFSVFGFVLIFTLGFVIILLSYILDPIMTCLQRKHGIARYQRLEWSTNSFLQLQRLAYEEGGQGSWSERDGDVPVTEREELLAGLDIEDPKNPRIGCYRGGAGEGIEEQDVLSEVSLQVIDTKDSEKRTAMRRESSF